MEIHIDPSWKKELTAEFEKPYFTTLETKVRAAYKDGPVFPHAADIFNAFNLCPFSKVRVVILGQDPYHGTKQAHGLSFSVPEGVKIPPSLKNIYKEIQADIGTPLPASGNLERWAKEGVLLLNATLTVLPGLPGSHQKIGWETFTDAVIKKISDEKEGVVFLLWGRFAQAKKALIDTEKHLVLEAAHPSPFSAHHGFFGCKHFSKTNSYLKERGQSPINW
jgi:uracil-DNA glycosylase